MRNEFTAVIERDGDWYVAYCPEIPGANGQGRTKDGARANLAEAIALILEDRRKTRSEAFLRMPSAARWSWSEAEQLAPASPQAWLLCQAGREGALAVEQPGHWRC